MKYYKMKQNLFLLNGVGFNICNENDETIFYARQNYISALIDNYLERFLSIGCKIIIEDKSKYTRWIIVKRPSILYATYDIYYNNMIISSIKREKGWLKHKFNITSTYGTFSLSGDNLRGSFQIIKDGKEVAIVNKVPLKFKDCYEVSIFDESNDLLYISIIIIINNCFSI